jgi:Double-GTPase 1
MLIGCPDSGKTNYLARLWKALQSSSGRLKLVEAPEVKYVEDALAHLLQGSFAPRSEKNIEESRRDFTATVAAQDDTKQIKIIVPDVTGELWKNAVSSLELSAEWMTLLKESSGALLFVRVHSELNVIPLDWVTARELLKMDWAESQQDNAIPTQVVLCELLRFLQLTLRKRSDGSLPRVAVVVTAWDRLDAEAKENGPSTYIESEYPLFAGRLEDVTTLEVKVFGVSVVGGDLQADPEFRQRFFESGDFDKAGYVAEEIDGIVSEEPDLTRPIAWLAGD